MYSDIENDKLSIILQDNIVSFESMDLLKPLGLKFSEAKLIESFLSYLSRKSFYWYLGLSMFLWGLMLCSTLYINAAVIVCISPLVHSFWCASYVFRRSLFLCTKFSPKISLKTHSFGAYYAKLLRWLDWAKEPWVCKLENAWRAVAAILQQLPNWKEYTNLKFFIKQQPWKKFRL